MNQPSQPRTIASTDVGIVLRKAVELLTQRPVPTIGSAVLAQLPTTLATTGALLALGPFFQGMFNSGSLGADESFEDMVRTRLLPNLPVLVGGGVLALVVIYLLYAIQVGAVMQVVVDAYARRTSTLGAALASGVRRAPTLMIFLLTKQLATVIVAGIAMGMFLLPLVAIPDGASYAGPVAAMLSIVGGLVAAVVAFGTWSMFSLGAGAIVAEKVGPFAALARGVTLARNDPATVLLTWLASGAVYMILGCVTNCCTSAITAPVQLGVGAIAGSVASQLVQLVPIAILGSAIHAVGAVLYGEFAGLGVERDPAEVADVFR